MSKLFMAILSLSLLSACTAQPRHTIGDQHDTDGQAPTVEPLGAAAEPRPAPRPDQVSAAESQPRQQSAPTGALQEPLQEPELKRTSVVIANGLRLPVLGYGLRYDSSDQELAKLVASMQALANPQLSFVAYPTANTSKVLCVNNVQDKAAYLGSLWSRVAHYTAEGKVQTVPLYQACDPSASPDFSYPSNYPFLDETSNTVARPQWLCRSDSFPDTTLNVFEKANLLSGKNSASLQLSSTMSDVSETLELTELGWLLGEQDELNFLYHSNDLRLLLKPYHPSVNGGVQAVLQRADRPDEALSCTFEK